MDSSNAEKATSLEELRMTPAERIMFTAGRASRDAEVAELTRLLAESRARFADSEARRAELEAVIEKAPHVDCATQWDGPEHSDTCNCWKTSAPSVVLEDRDRENRRIGWDEGERHESEYLTRFGQFCPGEHCNPYRGESA